MGSFKNIRTFLVKYYGVERKNTIIDWYAFVKDEGYILVDKEEFLYLKDFKKKILEGRAEKRCPAICPNPPIYLMNPQCRRKKGHTGKHRIVFVGSKEQRELCKMAKEEFGENISTTTW